MVGGLLISAATDAPTALQLVDPPSVVAHQLIDPGIRFGHPGIVLFHPFLILLESDVVTRCLALNIIPLLPALNALLQIPDEFRQFLKLGPEVIILPCALLGSFR